MVKIAFVFPGQGSQFVGMGKDFYDHYSEARNLFEEANEILQYDISRICFDGPEDTLRLTENTQPALLIHSIMALKILRENGINSVLAAGHSLGEFSALVAAGALKFQDAVRLVNLRGKFMQEAVPVGIGSMAAIIGLDCISVQNIIDEGNLDVQIANDNSPIQVVISGMINSIDKSKDIFLKKGAKKFVKLNVSAAFHSNLMLKAQNIMRKYIDETKFSDSDISIISNFSSKISNNSAAIKESLINQMANKVRWKESINELEINNEKLLIEIGPGKVLSGLVKRITNSFDIISIDQVKNLELFK